MKETTLKRAEIFVQNKDTLEKVFSLRDNLENLAGAAVLLSRNEPVEEQTIRDCRKILRDQTSIFSSFRDYVEPAAVAELALSDNPEDKMARSMAAFKALRQKFGDSSHLPIAAITMANHAQPFQYEELAQKAREIYVQERKKHPFLTSSEDSAFCTLIAIMGRPAEDVILETENCYQLLKKNFLDGNAVQALALILALSPEPAEEKCRRTMELFQLMKDKKHKYGTSYELASLGAVSMSATDYDSLSDEIIEVYEWLGRQKGFGFWSMLSDKEKLMYAALIIMQDHGQENGQDEAGQTAAISGIVSLVIAQEIALYAAISASAFQIRNNEANKID